MDLSGKCSRMKVEEQISKGAVPLYLFVGPERGLVAGPGMADCPCH